MMKQRNSIYFIGVLALLLIGFTSAEAHTRKGTVLVAGTAGFSSSSGDLYGDENRTVVNLSPTVQYFFVHQFALGGKLNWEHTSHGNASSSRMSIGPAVSYYFHRHSATIPYLGAGVYFQNYSSEFESGNTTISTDQSGATIALYGGVAVFLKQHLALTPELSVNLESLEDANGTTIMLGVGLAGFIYDPTIDDERYIFPDD